jgi:legumain
MMYDDIANNYRNPVKGNIINVPKGPNVYAGVKIDYKGRDVSPQNFISVLQGKATNAGNGRVIKSGPNDHVFVYFSDHGNRNLIGFPHGVLYASDLNKALQNMYSENKYEKLVFYMEACYSGTMFDKYLPKGHNVFAVTAANTRESSYAAFYDSSRRAYLADEFSVNWMKDTESHDASVETLMEQFQDIRKMTRRSHVMLYGDAEGMGSMKIGEFEAGSEKLYTAVEADTTPLPPMDDAVPSYDVPYMTLFHQLKDAQTPQERLEILHEMKAELKAQEAISGRMEGIVSAVSTSAQVGLLMKYQAPTTQETEEQQQCYEQAVQKYLDTCKGFQEFDYNMKHVHVFSNLCNQGSSTKSIVEAIEQVC